MYRYYRRRWQRQFDCRGELADNPVELGMIAFRAAWKLTGCGQFQAVVAVAATEPAGIADFSTTVGTGLVIFVFKSPEIEPAFIRCTGNHIDETIFYQGQVEAQPVFQFLTLLIECLVGFMHITFQRRLQALGFFLGQSVQFTCELLCIVYHFIDCRRESFLGVVDSFAYLVHHMIESGNQFVFVFVFNFHESINSA